MYNDAILKELYKGHVINIVPDNNYESPRECDNLGTILYTSSRYILGDKKVYIEDIDAIIKRKDAIYLNVYAYIHGGVCLNTSGFSCPWDSGQCGIIYTTKKEVLKNYNKKRITKKLLKLVYNSLKNEIKTFSDYLEGNTYGYQVFDESKDVIESCYGFIGDYDGYVLEEAKSIIDYIVKKDAIRSIEKARESVASVSCF